jgi:hypothetical protein
MKKRVLFLLGAVMLLAALPAGCAGLKEADVPYADDMVDNMMAGVTQNDYAVFSRDFSDTMKSSIDETAFASMAESLTAAIGTYESKRFSQAADTTQDEVAYTVVVYQAQFSEEDADVLITVTFSGGEDDKKIEGLYFNSPKLRGE